MTELLPVVNVDLCAERLALIFPRKAFDPALSSPGAAASAATMIYVGAVWDPNLEPPRQRWLRPSMVMWMSDQDLSHDSITERHDWYAAALGGKSKLIALLATRGENFEPRYGDNTREGPRDETWPRWGEYGAISYRTDVASTYPGPRWILRREFAQLFDPQLVGSALLTAIDAWREAHMTPSGRMKALNAQETAYGEHAVDVQLPNGQHRLLEPGGASLILRGVIESWAPSKLVEPFVLSISEPGDKVFLADKARLESIGLTIDPSRVLPDALIVDTGSNPFQFWVIEAVFSDGEINERRRAVLLRWAAEQGIDPNECHFLTAFSSRYSSPARRRLKDLAAGTSAWFLDEPEFELTWSRISTFRPAALARVTSLDNRRSS